MNDAVHIFLLSLIPTFEGRYAAIVGIGSGYPLWSTLSAAASGVLILSITLPLVLPFIDRMMLRLRGTFFGGLAELYLKYVERVRRRVHPYVERWGAVGLTIFVAVPLPGTGVWTGSLAAFLLGMGRGKTALALLLGGLLSILITVVPSLGITNL